MFDYCTYTALDINHNSHEAITNTLRHDSKCLSNLCQNYLTSVTNNNMKISSTLSYTDPKINSTLPYTDPKINSNPGDDNGYK